MKTPEKLKNYLSKVSKADFDKYWAEAKGIGITGPTIQEYAKYIANRPKPIVNKVRDNFMSSTFQACSQSDLDDYAHAA